MGDAVSNLYTVYSYDLNTNTLTGELPATALTFESRLNDAGPCTFNLASTAKLVLDMTPTPFSPTSTAIFIDRDGKIVWGGILWTRLFTKSAQQYQLGAKEFLSYFDQRKIAASYDAAVYPSGIDPAALIAAAITDCQNTSLCGPGASIGVTVTGASSSIPPIIPGYDATQNTLVGQIISDVSAAATPGSGGVDIAISPQWTGGLRGGTPTRVAQLTSPRSGRIGANSGLIFDLDMAIDYTWPEDGTQTGNDVTATATDSTSATLTSEATAAVSVGALGQPPRLDKVMSYSLVQSQSQLDTLAAGSAITYGGVVTTPTVTILADGDVPLGSWIIGDDARLFTSGNDRFPNGLDQYWRIVQQSVTVPDEGPAEVILTFNLPPAF